VLPRWLVTRAIAERSHHIRGENDTMRSVALIAVALAVAATGLVSAASPASNKAFFAKSTDGIILAAVDGPSSSEVTLFDIPQALKTSNGGAVSATLSMEASIWTYNLTTAIVNGGKNSSSSRAAIKAWVEIDGVPMEPGLVVYADRLQATGLTVNLACGTNVPDITCEVTGDVTTELFQAAADIEVGGACAGAKVETVLLRQRRNRYGHQCDDGQELSEDARVHGNLSPIVM
jgi:hypothetical protein